MWGRLSMFRSIRQEGIALLISLVICPALLSACGGTAPSPAKTVPGVIVTIAECLAPCVAYPVKTWEDLNQDGIYEEGEPPLPGVQSHLKVDQIDEEYHITDATGSIILNLCPSDTRCDQIYYLPIEVVVIAPDGCKNTTPANLPEKPEQKADRHSTPDEPYTFGFWCVGEASPTLTVLAPTGTP